MKARTSRDQVKRSRGRTRPGRLRLLDEALLAWLDRVPYPAVELGVGDRPDTVAEWFDRLSGPCVAVDHDPRRVQAALHAGLDARLGSFDLGFDAGLIRAVNVLRELGWERAPVRQMCAWLCPGGLLVEATTDRFGQIVAARLWGPEVLDRGWLFACDGQHGFHPRMFRGPVPRSEREVLDRWEARDGPFTQRTEQAGGRVLQVPEGLACWLPPVGTE